MMGNNKIENIIIIGGGPAGLAAAIYSARAGLLPVVFAGSPPGGQLMLTSVVENYPGFESIFGSELIEKMRKQGQKFGARIIDENVIRVDFKGKSFKIFLPENHMPHDQNFSGTKLPRLSRGQTTGSSKFGRFGNESSVFYTKSVIIATGAKALWLGLESERRFRGKGVSVCAACDGFFFRDKIVAVVGGGDTAMEEALSLTAFAKKIYVIHRRDHFRACKLMQNKVLQHPKIEVIWNAVVKEILGEKKVEGVKLKISNLKLKILKLDGLFVAIGHQPDTEIFKGQIELDEKGYIITKVKNASQNEKIEKDKEQFNLNFNYITSVPGVFAAGDCIDYQYRQVGTAVGTGIAAALETQRYLEQNY